MNASRTSSLHQNQVHSRAIADLIPCPRNARQHPQRHVEQLAKSIQTFGFTVPILVDAQDAIIAGHGRLLAAKHLGISTVPTITLDKLTPDQIKAYRIADNRLTEISTWDDRLLAEQLQELSVADLDFDLTVIGFDLPEIDLRIQSLDGDSEDADAFGPGISDGPVISQLGDLWCLGLHRLLCGNALNPDSYTQLMQGQRVDVVFTDPPYNVPIQGHVCGKGGIQHPEFAMASGEMSAADFTQFLQKALLQMDAVTKEGALAYVCMDWRHLGELQRSAPSSWDLKNLCVWDKGVGGMGSLYRSQHELVLVYKIGKGSHTNNVQLGRFGRNRTNVWSYPGVNSFARKTDEGNLLALHPTVKPIALVADVLLDASDRGGVVLDPFMGSGTTLIAAQKTGRVAMGMELSPQYVDTAIRRWQTFTGQYAVHAVSGARFDDHLPRSGSDPVPVSSSSSTSALRSIHTADVEGAA